MTVELEDFDSSYDVCRHLDWALESGIWNGRQVSWVEAPELYDEIQTRILEQLFEHPEQPLFEELSLQFARLGTSISSRSLLERDIEELELKNNLVHQAGVKKSISKF